MQTNVTLTGKVVTKKSFRILPILSLITGVVQERQGMGMVEELMQHMFPGIGTIGMAVMRSVAVQDLVRQYPFLKELVPAEDAPRKSTAEWDAWLKVELPKLPMALDVEGPVEVTPAQLSAASDAFFKSMDKAPKVLRGS